MDEPREVGHLEELAETLWQERHLTELLLYKLVCTRLLLAADEQRYTGLAISEVDGVLSTLRSAELRRDDVIQALAVSWGVAIDEVSLTTLVERAPAPWSGIFADHQRAFRALTVEIEETAEENRRLAASGLQRVRQTMNVLTGRDEGAISYDPSGHQRAAVAGPALLDQAL